jgi:hypothetical protein
MVVKPILAEEISENPCCSGNREGLGDFAPIRMIGGSETTNGTQTNRLFEGKESETESQKNAADPIKRLR